MLFSQHVNIVHFPATEIAYSSLIFVKIVSSILEQS